MGSKLSCIHGSSEQANHQLAPPAMVIAADGSLKELPATPAVADVVGGSGTTTPSFFVCNSDALYFNERPPALAPGEPLLPGQIYFVLPAAMLGQPLSIADMAALAASAAAALAPRRRGVRRGGRKTRKERVVPVLEDQRLDGTDADDVWLHEKLNERTLGGEFPVSPSPAKKNDAKLAAAAATARRRLKRALSIIQEDAE
ncbi:hypothetical protein GUJ93_ZPchr0002g24302 [Zizania palustris]|uniref:Uncharacterized protein n=1 Tax=Zizania palustris TaxID=103762 RepID=A0A8J5VVR0_ZIZPA|nr:hypothetical protein GUJ93_ZPchr0002g24302 [Zizania palustris]